MAREFRTSSQQEENLAKVFLNSDDDYIYINEKDATIFDRFAAFMKWLEEKEADIRKKEEEHEKRFGKDIVKVGEDGEVEDVNVDAFVQFSRLRTETYKESAGRIDDIFGKGTLRKYFRKFYEVNPDFVPDDECLYDFIEEMTPILNELFADRSKRLALKYNRDRKGGKRSRYRNKNELIRDYSGRK